MSIKPVFIALVASFLLAGFVSPTAAQARKRKPTPKPVATPASTPTPTPAAIEEPVVVVQGSKKNERPVNGATVTPSEPAKVASPDVRYTYEFSQPNFDISKIVIAHDDAGRGTITFTRKMFDDTETDPLQVSDSTLARINGAYDALRFLDSNESYQYEKDFSHLGVMTFGLKRGTTQRLTTFNYTENKDARVLADEYRKLGNQYIWIFDIGVARENQPLQSPRLLDNLDSLIRRKEISDPVQMIPLLKELSNDERVPLIARNHAGRLIQQIGKVKKND